MTDRDIHRLGLPVRCAALGLPDTTIALSVLHEWGEATWTANLDYRIEVLGLTVERAARSDALLAAAGSVRPRRVSC